MENEPPSVKEPEESCMSACLECALACEKCITSCLRGDEPARTVGLITTARTCIDVCSLTAKLLAQESEFAVEYAALCAEVCHTLREDCLKQMKSDECQKCCEMTLRCEQTCQQVAA